MSARYVIIAAAIILFAGALLYAADYKSSVTNGITSFEFVPSKVGAWTSSKIFRFFA
jgi:hypothetical protein